MSRLLRGEHASDDGSTWEPLQPLSNSRINDCSSSHDRVVRWSVS
ncbi:hypothetical protein RSSM_00699 [Rhodopirellula sallentina SM41]|uniref:Uncharacterized protein n=1 Tax=Rhodopirellula sallentina SM41 TaxID=1263870 RepID=M5U8W6_9BACT|nr:hypothetical protein RSSM_00699 [Rhodopirellula sallentina SM41]